MQSTESTSEARFSHIGLSTLELDKTREFYERVLVADAITIQEGVGSGTSSSTWRGRPWIKFVG
jgi:hypothetical protein